MELCETMHFQWSTFAEPKKPLQGNQSLWLSQCIRETSLNVVRAVYKKQQQTTTYSGDRVLKEACQEQWRRVRGAWTVRKEGKPIGKCSVMI